LVIDAIGAAMSEWREYRTAESLWSMMSTELDLSFGVRLGFEVAVKAKTVSSVPANAAVRVRRPR
jgi:hypothetical protein